MTYDVENQALVHIWIGTAQVCNIPPVEARAGKAVPDRASTGGITF
jgi:hypothetical protein